MDKHDFAGIHIISEMYGIPDELINNEYFLLNTLLQGTIKSGATIEGVLTKKFSPFGYSAIILLSESHASIHTYPERHAIFVDAFTCGSNCRTERIIDEMIKRLRVKNHNTQIIQRGDSHGAL